MKQFKSKKIRKRKKITKFIFVFFFFFAYVFVIRYCITNKLTKSVLDKDVNYMSFNLNEFISTKINNVINEPVLLLNTNVKNADKIETKTKKVNKNNDNPKESVSTTENNNDPLIYVYNTHQTEGYVDYSVYDGAAELTNKLNKSGVNTIFEEQSVSAFLQQNNLKYYKSYTVSRKYLQEALVKHPSIKCFIDFHRDSVSKAKSTFSYNGKNYAKVLFIVGLDNPGYNTNLENTNRLNSIIESKVPGLSRGVMQKGGKGVDGVYNQDVSSNLFLIEVGSDSNTKEEVQNTINVIYESVLEYVRGVV